ncbi:double-strand break repair helicase AddA [Aerophototrophica crusticola]|uniref:DNA 3'-5' helicase n=1 Tax=Aerophototrophica crusticola TaxID=1709002 RepID=A0A858R2U5_9PROT|nr:double-strand break repair helicase AddA [Rhodospirillaceae bacterium B3]
MSVIDLPPRQPAADPQHLGDAPATDPNVLQRRAADPGCSVWVGASAGTGKTKVLTDRVLRLMLAGTDPSRILCLTFTKAAAAEMSNRIAARLSSWAVADEDVLRSHLRDLTGGEPSRDQVVAARRLFARMLDAPGGMKIQTIHAFCQSLLRRFPLEAGLPPNFEVMDDRTADELLEAAKQAVLAAARAEPESALGQAVSHLAGAVSEDEFGRLLLDITAERGRLRRLLERHGGLEAAVRAVYGYMGVRPDATEAHVVEKACKAGAFDDSGLRAACAALAASGKTDGERGIAIQAWLDRAENRTGGFPAYGLLFLTKDGEVRKSLLGKKAAESNPAALEALQREAERIIRVMEEVKCVTVARSTASLLTLADSMLGTYQRLKDAKALLDFDDLIATAGALLAGDGQACAWVLFKLDGGLDHILVDEAQDTNPEQWAVVQAIAEEFFAGLGRAEGKARTLFVVGDDKQSIFSFQRADPAEFARMRGHFETRVKAAESQWAGIDLQISFRSVRAVLAAVDAVFELPAARDGVVAPDKAVRHMPFRRGMAGRVEVWPPVTPGDSPDPDPWSLPLTPETAEKPLARLATVIAAQVRHWLDSGEVLEARGRKVRPGDIMVLVRRRNAFVQHLVRALKDRGVPVAGVDRMVLTEQLAVMDLMALGGFLLLPEDDLTLATVLKSPLVGLTEEQLFTLAHGRPGSLWAALSVKAQQDPAYEPAQRWLHGLLAETDFHAPFELFAGVLSRPCPADPTLEEGGSGRRAILARLGSEAVDPLDEFLSAALLFEREHVPSLQGFLHWLEQSQAEVKRELDTGGGPGGGRVRIMTVHGSKGLQAPIVIMPDTLGMPDQSPRILWPDGTDGRDVPLFAPRRTLEDAACRTARAAADQRRDQEYRRLLYVALTRAEDRLVVCGYEGSRKGPDGSWYRLVEQALATVADPRDYDFTPLTPAGWQGQGLHLWEPQVVPARTDELGEEEGAVTAELEPWVRAPAPEEPSPSRPLTPSRPDGVEPAVRSPLGMEDGRRFKRGTLIHKLLQVLPDMEPARRREAALAWLSRPTHGLEEGQREEIAGEAIRVLDDPHFAPLFGPGSRAEVPLVGLVGSGSRKALSGQIDRLCVTDDAVWIVDYKTNRPPPTREEDVPAVYLAQMAAYRAALRQVYPGKQVRCVLLWTDGPFTLELSPTRLDEYDPA